MLHEIHPSNNWDNRNLLIGQRRLITIGNHTPASTSNLPRHPRHHHHSNIINTSLSSFSTVHVCPLTVLLSLKIRRTYNPLPIPRHPNPIVLPTTSISQHSKSWSPISPSLNIKPSCHAPDTRDAERSAGVYDIACLEEVLGQVGARGRGGVKNAKRTLHLSKPLSWTSIHILSLFSM